MSRLPPPNDDLQLHPNVLDAYTTKRIPADAAIIWAVVDSWLRRGHTNIVNADIEHHLNINASSTNRFCQRLKAAGLLTRKGQRRAPTIWNTRPWQTNQTWRPVSRR